MVFTTVNMKNAVFPYMTPCSSCKERSFGGKYRLHQFENNQLARNNWEQLQLVVTANVVPSSLILVTLMTEAIRSSKM
jgi:hypothetical protein